MNNKNHIRYIFLKSNLSNTVCASVQDRSLVREASYVFHVDDSLKVTCVKDRDNRYMNKIYVGNARYNRLTDKQRVFLCKLLLERHTNPEILKFINDVTVEHLVKYLLSNCYSDQAKTRLNLIRKHVIKMNNKDFYYEKWNTLD